MFSYPQPYIRCRIFRQPFPYSSSSLSIFCFLMRRFYHYLTRFGLERNLFQGVIFTGRSHRSPRCSRLEWHLWSLPLWWWANLHVSIPVNIYPYIYILILDSITICKIINLFKFQKYYKIRGWSQNTDTKPEPLVFGLGSPSEGISGSVKA